jgi:serine protease
VRQLFSLFVTIAISAAALPVTLAAAAESIDQRSDQQAPLSTSSRVVITYGPTSGAASSRSLTPSAESRMVVDLGRTVTAADLESFEGPGVIAVEPDVLLKPLTVPNDPNVGSQWDLSDAASGAADFSIKAPGAWASTTGDASLVVAVLDTGITTHSEFSGRLVSGYDFVSNTLMGNDGNGRDNNPADPGDWITSSENRSGTFAGCGTSNSSWHGTHVTGTIGATGNNGIGIAGINWTSKILPVRVLGKCGGYGSDIADAIAWASGGTVSGISNPNPARIISLSLGGSGSCPAYMQGAIDEARGRGALVVVAAGNGNENVSLSMPANCVGVIAVAATGRNGKRAYYSNFGAGIAIAAPGGNSYSDSKILSTLNSGTQGPRTESYASYQGTSMAAPHVAGVLSLLLSISPGLSESEVLDLIGSTATTFPEDLSLHSCSSSSQCGSGIINATDLIEAVLTDRGPQSIEFVELEPRYAGTSAFSPGATASSGLAVSYSATPATICTSNGTLVTLKAAGACTITASQGGNLEYLPASPVSRNITVLATTRPALVTDATFVGSPQVGNLLTLTAGTWSGAPEPAIQYQWYRCGSSGVAVSTTRDPRGCSAISSAIGLTYTPLASDNDRYLRVRQVATNASGSLARFSTTSAIVASTPSLISSPSISGRPRVGRVTTARTGRYSGSSPLNYTYGWYACGGPVSASPTLQEGCTLLDGATSSSFVPTVLIRGSFLVVRVTIANTVGTLTTYSASSPAVQ